MNELDELDNIPAKLITAGSRELAPMMPVPGQIVQQVRSTYATAVQVQMSRTIADVERRLLEEAKLAGEEFYYGWGAGKNAVEGPSVKLAMALARCWGNCATEILPLQDLGDAWLFTAAFVDLETGFTLQRQFRQSKRSTVAGKLDEERKDDIRFQIGQSKAVRNVVLNALPASLVSRALAAAKSGVRAKIEAYVKTNGLAKAADMLINSLGKAGVKEERVLAKFAIADRRGLVIDHLVTLRGDLHAIEEGHDRADDLFPQIGESKTVKPEAATPAPAPTPIAPPVEAPPAPTPVAPVEPPQQAQPEPPAEEQHGDAWEPPPAPTPVATAKPAKGNGGNKSEAMRDRR